MMGETGGPKSWYIGVLILISTVMFLVTWVIFDNKRVIPPLGKNPKYAVTVEDIAIDADEFFTPLHYIWVDSWDPDAAKPITEKYYIRAEGPKAIQVALASFEVPTSGGGILEIPLLSKTNANHCVIEIYEATCAFGQQFTWNDYAECITPTKRIGCINVPEQLPAKVQIPVGQFCQDTGIVIILRSSGSVAVALAPRLAQDTLLFKPNVLPSPYITFTPAPTITKTATCAPATTTPPPGDMTIGFSGNITITLREGDLQGIEVDMHRKGE